MIDAHHHLWRYTPEDYRWISPPMGALRRDFLPGDLAPVMQMGGIEGTVVVQARQTLEETEWLLDLADQFPFMRGVVGWAPLCSSGLRAILQQWRHRPKLKALRHIVQDEPDGFLLRDDFNRGMAALLDTGLVYDLLIFERQLPEAITFVRRHPEQVFVLNHLAKPRVRAGSIQPWQDNVERIAENPNVFCKLSGLVTEANRRAWTPDQLRPYLDAALRAFGAGRLIAGSDWPVCLLAASYAQWWSTLTQWAEKLQAGDRANIFGETARRVYRFTQSEG